MRDHFDFYRRRIAPARFLRRGRLDLAAGGRLSANASIDALDFDSLARCNAPAPVKLIRRSLDECLCATALGLRHAAGLHRGQPRMKPRRGPTLKAAGQLLQGIEVS